MKRMFRQMRKWLFFLLARRGIAAMVDRPKINHKCKFNGLTFLGKNTNFNGCIIKGKGKVVIGDNFHSGSGLLMLTSSHNYCGEHIPYDRTTIDKDIFIEDNVWIGERVIILGGVCIGEGAIIQAGSVVAKSIEPLVIAGGHPAEPFKQRDPVHYFSKKEQGLFH